MDKVTWCHADEAREYLQNTRPPPILQMKYMLKLRPTSICRNKRHKICDKRANPVSINQGSTPGRGEIPLEYNLEIWVLLGYGIQQPVHSRPTVTIHSSPRGPRVKKPNHKLVEHGRSYRPEHPVNQVVDHSETSQRGVELQSFQHHELLEVQRDRYNPQ